MCTGLILNMVSAAYKPRRHHNVLQQMHAEKRRIQKPMQGYSSCKQFLLEMECKNEKKRTFGNDKHKSAHLMHHNTQ